MGIPDRPLPSSGPRSVWTAACGVCEIRLDEISTKLRGQIPQAVQSADSTRSMAARLSWIRGGAGMRRNVIVLGDRTLASDYGPHPVRRRGAPDERFGAGDPLGPGELRLSHCQVEKVRSVGELDAQDLQAGQIRSTGAAQLKGHLLGDTWCHWGSLEAESLKVRLLCGSSEYGQMQSLGGRGVLQGRGLSPCPARWHATWSIGRSSCPRRSALARRVACRRCYGKRHHGPGDQRGDHFFCSSSPRCQLDYLEGGKPYHVAQLRQDRDFRPSPSSSATKA